MRSLSIGSPLVNHLRRNAMQRGLHSQSLQTELQCFMTTPAYRVLRELFQQRLEAHMKLLSESRVTASMYHSVETLAGFLVEITCSTMVGIELKPSLKASCWIKDCQNSPLHQFRTLSYNPRVQEFLVWTSPQIILPVQSHRPEPSFDGFPQSLSNV